MTDLDRRKVAKLAGAFGLFGAVGPTLSPAALSQTSGKVVVIGGGAGGATLAHYLKRGERRLDVTLIEASPRYSSSFFSNLYLGDLRTFNSLNHDYMGLQRLGVKIVRDFATDVDSTRRIVRTASGRTFAYDRLALSPGIDIKFDSIAGYSKEVAQHLPHAYTSDGSQKQLLKRQLEAMPDGGVVLMVMPNNPYRCPPGPYERVCMIAHYLKAKKPKSKIIILDPKKNFSKQPVFTEAFDRYYPGLIELNLSDEIDSFAVTRVDAKAREVEIKDGKKWKGDVINVIPQQSAGAIAIKAGCAQGDWCPIKPENFKSAKVENIYVIGDAAIAAEMPKSAFAANNQAKAVAGDMLADLAGKERFPPRYRNTCWSMLAPEDSAKIGANYTPKDGRLDSSGGFVSQPGEDAAVRKQNYAESVAWYASITSEMFATGAVGAEVGGKAG
jgi:NADPH-dependent 2,4-dienoyl-CoA reductase/sulfur reductase-like enzyme